MADVIAGEGGKTLVVPTEFDITNAVSATLKRWSPIDIASDITMAVGTVALDIDGFGPIAAGYYAQYIIQTTDFVQDGRWKLQLHVNMGAGVILKSDEVLFVVGPSL